MPSLIQDLVRFADVASFESLPSEVTREAKRLLLDAVACALASHSIEKGQAALRVARRMGGPGEATVIGAGEKLHSTSAAFANGELINAMDFDALLTPPGHVSPYVIPASPWRNKRDQRGEP